MLQVRLSSYILPNLLADSLRVFCGSFYAEEVKELIF